MRNLFLLFRRCGEAFLLTKESDRAIRKEVLGKKPREVAQLKNLAFAVLFFILTVIMVFATIAVMQAGNIFLAIVVIGLMAWFFVLFLVNLFIGLDKLK